MYIPINNITYVLGVPYITANILNIFSGGSLLPGHTVEVFFLFIISFYYHFFEQSDSKIKQGKHFENCECFFLYLSKPMSVAW